MKTFVKSALISVGSIGLVIAIPSAIFCGMMYRGFGGSLIFTDYLIFLSPIFCIALIVSGRLIKKEP